MRTTTLYHFISLCFIFFVVWSSCGSAGLIISVQPVESQVSLGEVASFDVVATVPVGSKLYYWGGDLTFTGLTNSTKGGGLVTLLGTKVDSYWEKTAGTDLDGLCGSNRTGITGQVVLFSFDVQGVSKGLVSVTFTQTPGDSNETFGSSPSSTVVSNGATIEVVPEPASLAVLLFGTLFCKRKAV